jgi:hypothetical protein
MFSIPLILFLTVIMAIVQISIFKSLPNMFRKFFASLLLLAVICNFLLSGLILLFTAQGFLAGVSNLGGSVIFGIYLVAYKNKHQIGKLTLEWCPIYCALFSIQSWRIKIPCVRKPHIYITEGITNPEPKWLW